MFSLTLTETSDFTRDADVETDFGTIKGGVIPPQTFEHFRQNYREFPADKLARIQAILAEPPAPQRKTRADAGKARAPKITTPPQPTLNIQ